MGRLFTVDQGGKTPASSTSDESSPIPPGSKKIFAEGLSGEEQTEIEKAIPPEEVQAVLEKLRLKAPTPESNLECIPAASSLSLPPFQHSVSGEGEQKSNGASGKVF